MKKQIGLFTVILFAVSIAMVACKAEVHTHTFSSKWTSDETNHWHAATCEHKDKVIDKAKHTFGDWTITKEPTEEAEGSREKSCTVCGYTTVPEVIEKLPHTHKFETEWTSDAENHWYAATCEHTTEVSGKAEHSFGEWTVTKEATEEAEGSKERTCTVCGYTATEAIEKLAHTHKFSESLTKDETHHWYAATCGHTTEVSEKAEHTFGNWTTTKEATEEAEGSKERTCTVCGYTATEAIAKLPHTHKFASEWTSDETNHWHSSTCGHEVTEGKTTHTFGDWTITKEPTEEAEGSREKSCSVCEYTVPEVIAKLPHTHKFATDWTKDETNHWHASTCGHEVTEGKTAHTFGDWTTTKEATCTEEGNKTRTCEVCKKEVIEKIDAKGHNYSETWTSDETNHWHATTCGHEVTEGKTAHTFGDWTITKEPTEEAEGSREKSCTVCEYTVPEVIAKLEHTHKFAIEWTKDETNHWHASTCGHEVTEGKTAHTFGDWITTKAATCTEEGNRTRTCEVCKKEVTKKIPAKGHSLGNWTVTKDPTETEVGQMQRVCKVCEETETKELEGFKFVKGTTITGTERWTPESEVFVSERKLTIPDLIVSDHEVTRGEYKDVMGSVPSSARAYDKDGNKLTGEDVLNNPVNGVEWFNAIVYCNKLSMKEGFDPCYSIEGSTEPDVWGEVPTSFNNISRTKWDAVSCNWNANGYRLPTEAEWEWLARGGENYKYAGSDNVDDVAWYTSNTNRTGTRDVKTKAPNGYGLHDMSGNVWEWCWDRYDSISSSSAADGAASGNLRVYRGGCFYYDDSYCLVARRNYLNPISNGYDLGFRVVRLAK